MIGKIISHYKILDQLGRGGMGIVYKAEDMRLNRLVALKFLPLSYSADDESKNRFMREAQAASTLDHPNICNIHQIDETKEGQIFIVMGYYEGKTLKEKIVNGPIPLEKIIDIAAQIAVALKKAHENGIVHRDIKPANIMITNEGVVKILDFGLAKLTNSEHHTKSGSTIGTIAYMSPEQVQGVETDDRADIWSFGVVLYEMLTGSLPFKGEQDPALMWSIVNEEPEPMSALRADIPDEYERIIKKALEKEKEDRYQHMDEIEVDLRRLKRDTSKVSTRADASLYESSKNEKTKGGKRIKFGAALITIMVVVLILVFYNVLMQEPALPPTSSTPFSSLPGSEIHPAFSPDGREIAFAWNGGHGNNYDIYVQIIGTHKLQQLTDNLGADTHPIWTHDGRHIIFHRTDQEKLGLYLISARGGREQELYSYHHSKNSPNPYAFSTPNRADNRMIRPYRPLPHNSFAISADEKHVIGRYRTLPQTPFRLVSFGFETDHVDTLTTPPAGLYGDFLLALSPNGQTLAFTRCSMGNRGMIFTKSMITNELKQITFDEYHINGLAWTADGSEIIYSHSGSNLSYLSSEGLWRVPATGGTPKPVTLSGPYAQNPAVSKQGDLLAYCVSSRYTNLHKLNLENLHQANSLVKLELSSRSDNSGSISPDGSKIAYRSDRTWKQEIWICDLDGENAYAVTNETASCRSKGSPRWSPDGRLIAFDAVPAGQAKRDIFTVNPQTGVIKQVTTDVEYDAVPQWSKDGQWIYFRSKRSGDQQIWKIPFNGGKAVQMTQSSGYHAMESADGQWLYYSKRQENGIWKVRVDGGEEIKVMDDAVHKKNWFVVDHGIYYMRLLNSSFVIEFQNFETGDAMRIAEIEGEPDIYIDVSQERNVLLFSKFDREESDIMLVENFR